MYYTNQKGLGKAHQNFLKHSSSHFTKIYIGPNKHAKILPLKKSFLIDEVDNHPTSVFQDRVKFKGLAPSFLLKNFFKPPPENSNFQTAIIFPIINRFIKQTPFPSLTRRQQNIRRLPRNRQLRIGDLDLSVDRLTQFPADYVDVRTTPFFQKNLSFFKNKKFRKTLKKKLRKNYHAGQIIYKIQRLKKMIKAVLERQKKQKKKNNKIIDGFVKRLKALVNVFEQMLQLKLSNIGRLNPNINPSTSSPFVFSQSSTREQQILAHGINYIHLLTFNELNALQNNQSFLNELRLNIEQHESSLLDYQQTVAFLKKYTNFYANPIYHHNGRTFTSNHAFESYAEFLYDQYLKKNQNLNPYMVTANRSRLASQLNAFRANEINFIPQLSRKQIKFLNDILKKLLAKYLKTNSILSETDRQRLFSFEIEHVNEISMSRESTMKKKLNSSILNKIKFDQSLEDFCDHDSNIRPVLNFSHQVKTNRYNKQIQYPNSKIKSETIEMLKRLYDINEEDIKIFDEPCWQHILEMHRLLQNSFYFNSLNHFLS